MATAIQVRRDSSSNWASNNPVLLSGEFGLATDLNLFKIGNSASTWNQLEYASIKPSDYLTLVAASSHFLTKTDANSIYATLSSASLTGTPTAPTASVGTNTRQIATTEFVRNEVSSLIDSAPATLDTLNELAAALGDDPNYATSTASYIATKLDISSASATYLRISDAVSTYMPISGSPSLITLANAYSYQVYTDSVNVASSLVSSASSTLQNIISNTASVLTNNFQENISNSIHTHSTASTNIHGIPNTGLLETITGSQQKADAAYNNAVSYAYQQAASSIFSASTALINYINSTITSNVNSAVVSASAFTISRINNLVSNAPETLDTLNEIALALNNTADYAVATASVIASKLSSSDAQQTYLRINSASTTYAFKDNPTITGTATISNISIPTGGILNAPAKIEQKTSGYTFVLTDAGKTIEMNGGSSLSFTVPPDSSVNFPVGSQIHLIRIGSGAVPITAGAGVTIHATPGLFLRAQYSSATLIKRNTNTWILIGDLSST